MSCFWETPPPNLPTNLTLSSQDVHLWLACVDLPVLKREELTQLLSEDEKRRSERFRFDRDRNHFIARRGILRQILSRYLSLEPQKIQLESGPHGKPAILQQEGKPLLHFNLSHSSELALYGITRNWEIGVDIEKHRPISDLEKLAARFFTSAESRWLNQHVESEKEPAFFKIWTCKEAYLKAIGEGLAFGLDQVEFSFPAGERPKLIAIKGNTQDVSQWFLQQLNLPPHFPNSVYTAAIALNTQNPTLTYYQWSN